METILVDVRRFYRAVLDALVAKRVAKPHELRAHDAASNVSASSAPRIKAKKETIRTGREEYEMYRKVTFDKMPPL